MRVFASFAVIILHVAAQNWRNVEVNSFDWKIFNFYDSMFTWCVAVFVMISGALFLSRDIGIEKLYLKYVLRIVISFVAWSAIYSVLKGGDLINKASAFLRGHYHMWYLFMIVGLYICIPILKSIVKNGSTRYFLMLGLIFSFIIPDIITLVNDFGNGIVKKAVNLFADNIKTMNIYIILGYTFYFVLGYYISKKEFEQWQRFIIYMLGISGCIITICLTLMISVRLGKASDNYYYDFFIGILLEAIAVFTFFKYKSFNNISVNALIRKLSKYSFGAYLVHALVIEAMNKMIGLNTLAFNSAIAVPCIAVVVFILSFGISAVLNRIPFVNKYMV